MPIKIVSAVIAITLMLLYLVPIAAKLQDLALACVMLLGVVMMLVDAWQSLAGNDT